METLEKRLLRALNEKQESNKGLEARLLNALQVGSVRQVTGEVPTISTFRKILPTKKELPELGATFLAGLKASRLAALPAAGAVGTASLATEIGKQVIEPFREVPQIPSFTEALKRQAAAFGRGALGEIVPRGIGKLVAPFRKTVSPEIETVRKTAETVGITPPLSTLSEAKTVQALERFGEVSPFGRIITTQKKKALEELENFSKRIGQNIAPDRPPELTGNLAKEAAKSFKEIYDATKDKLYNAVLPVLKDTPVDTIPIIVKINQIIGRRSGIAESKGLNLLRKWAKELRFEKPSLATLTGGKEGKISSFQQLRNFRTNVGMMGKFDDPALSGLRSDINELYGTITEVMDNTTSKVSPEIAERLKEADVFFQQGKSTLKSKVYNALINTNPENIHKVVIVPNGASQVKIGKEILGEDAFKDIQRQWFDSILKNSTKVKEGDAVLNPLSLANNLKKYSATTEEMFKDSPELLKQFKDLENISKLMTRGKGITEGSQTAFLAQILAPVMTAFYSPQAALGLLGFLGLQATGTRALTTKFGRELLTRGFPRIERGITRTLQPTVQLGLQKLTENKQ